MRRWRGRAGTSKQHRRPDSRNPWSIPVLRMRRTLPARCVPTIGPTTRGCLWTNEPMRHQGPSHMLALTPGGRGWYLV